MPLPLMARKRTATLLYTTDEFLTVLEFFAVGESPTAVLLRAVKGGGSLPQTKISAIFKVHLSLFLLTQFFIVYLTLPRMIHEWQPMILMMACGRGGAILFLSFYHTGRRLNRWKHFKKRYAFINFFCGHLCGFRADVRMNAGW